VVGVDGHPADRIDRQSFVVALALLDGLIEDDGLSDVAKRPPTALTKGDASIVPAASLVASLSRASPPAVAQ
jgi:hypothetical protein